MGNKISIDTGDVASGPVYDLGTFFIRVPDEDVMRYMDAFVKLGFTPRHEVTDE